MNAMFFWCVILLMEEIRLTSSYYGLSHDLQILQGLYIPGG